MIQELFITDLNSKVILGNEKLFPSQPSYPVHETNGSRLCQLKTNDVIIAILYTTYDNFTAAKILLEIKKSINDKLLNINAKSVKENYFSVLELIQHTGSLISHKAFIKANLDLQAYIDVTENTHTIISKNNTLIKNSIFGSITLTKGNQSILKALIKKPTKYDLVSSSNYTFSDCLNKIEICARDLKENDNMLTYSIPQSKNMIFNFKKKGSCYTLICDQKHRFKYIEIIIPVSSSTYHANLKPTAGHATFNMGESKIIWKFEDFVFNSESITIDTRALDEKRDGYSIFINFNIPGWTESGLSVESCSSNNDNKSTVWIHYTTQSGVYEIKQ